MHHGLRYSLDSPLPVKAWLNRVILATYKPEIHVSCSWLPAKCLRHALRDNYPLAHSLNDDDEIVEGGEVEMGGGASTSSRDGEGE